jgi:hypothetical protein
MADRAEDSSGREIFNPFGEKLHKMSLQEKADAELAALWALYLNGGGGMPWHFDGDHRDRER